MQGRNPRQVRNVLSIVIGASDQQCPSAPASLTMKEITMPIRIVSFGLLGILFLVIPTFLGGISSEYASGAPAPKSNPYALLYIPKKTSQSETTQYRRRQI